MDLLKMASKIEHFIHGQGLEAQQKCIETAMKRSEQNAKAWTRDDVVYWFKLIEDGRFENETEFDGIYASLSRLRINGSSLHGLMNSMILKLMGLDHSEIEVILKNLERILHGNKKQKQEEEGAHDICQICAEKRIDSVIHPCMHQFCCLECYNEHKGKMEQRCPICRGNIKRITQTFMSGLDRD